MVLRLDFERGVCDVVSSLKEVPRLIKDGVGVRSLPGHEVDGRDVHPRGENPCVKVVDIDHAVNSE